MKKSFMILTIAICMTMSFSICSSQERPFRIRQKIHPVYYFCLAMCYGICLLGPFASIPIVAPKIQDRCDELKSEYSNALYGNSSVPPFYCGNGFGGVTENLILLGIVSFISYGCLFTCVVNMCGRGFCRYNSDFSKLRKIEEKGIQCGDERKRFLEPTASNSV